MSGVRPGPYKEVAASHKRKSIETYVSLFNGKTLVFSIAADISEGGMRLRTDSALKVGENLEVRFFLPNGEFISTHSKVAHMTESNTGEFVAGIQFLKISELAQSRIGAYVQEN